MMSERERREEMGLYFKQRLINIINTFDSNQDVRDGILPYIWVHSEGQKEFSHGQYAFAIYGKLGGLDVLKGVDLKNKDPKTSFTVCDAGNSRYFEKVHTLDKNNFNIERLPDTKATTAAPTIALQTMSELFKSPFHSESMIIKSLFYFTHPAHPVPALSPQPIRIASDRVRANNINGPKVEPYPTPEPDSGDSVTNLLYPTDPTTQRLYVLFSRQWDLDYCHYFNVRQLADTPGIQVVSAATNRDKIIQVGFQSLLLIELLRMSTIDLSQPDGSKKQETFIFPTTSASLDDNWKYLIDQAFDYFSVNFVQNFRSYENWKEFLDSKGYPKQIHQIVKGHFLWSQKIQKLYRGSRKLMDFQFTMIPIDPPFNIPKPTCKPGTTIKEFPYEFKAKWIKVLIESPGSVATTMTMTPIQQTQFVTDISNDFSTKFESFYSNSEKKVPVLCATKPF
ncbi:hypothetical protein DFA_12259 [Cavenderia fasciculata]|uniref:Uncharacterized protein n=1 Tax=Cavenderia fasciculata TaxID=261658 RepID=F4QCW1_CACFS|nr:uncharacterized protein DFA_12259 [Cavenderia fasciculata]EGG14485.1 hypothetical protein DFA_12259 [Cavenderia fasciculata]|eukprot:XP_004353894.1 hypothetical protein DFA_12259 [Cavenderia fasciculata]